jgi:hypothetical protein
MTKNYSKDQIAQILKTEEGKDLLIHLSDYLNLMRILRLLNENKTENENQVERWFKERNLFLKKTLFHANSIYTLSFGTEFVFSNSQPKPSFIDLFSIDSILRAQLEAILVYKSIYVLPNNDSEKLFYYWIWNYSAIKQMDDIFEDELSKYPIEESIKNNAAQNKIELNSLLKQINESIYSPNFKNTKRPGFFSKICMPNSKETKKLQFVIEECGFGDYYIKGSLYMVLSNTSHAEGMSKIYFAGKKSFFPHPDNIHAQMKLFISKLLLSVLIMDEINLSASGKTIHQNLEPTLKEQISSWNALAHANR